MGKSSIQTLLAVTCVFQNLNLKFVYLRSVTFWQLGFLSVVANCDWLQESIDIEPSWCSWQSPLPILVGVFANVQSDELMFLVVTPGRDICINYVCFFFCVLYVFNWPKFLGVWLGPTDIYSLVRKWESIFRPFFH